MKKQIITRLTLASLPASVFALPQSARPQPRFGANAGSPSPRTMPGPRVEAALTP